MNNKYNLFKRILELSKSKNWDEARKEWAVVEITEAQADDPGSCCCGKHPIKEMIQIFNQKTRNEVIVGNCCIKRFFDINDYDKVFKALKENRINSFMIEDCFKKEVINPWEYGFALNVWRKKKVSKKQFLNFEKIKHKILNFYKKISMGGEK
ncbi:hypothetical protein COU53_02090 [Candidatus Pacearchaeota archaeon CG10_big_fil_rev_8_21_14_0_10_30_48]|nr:MAG: hypothetical protein COU53_02090 [Candidatus Pacearchaeota archaeon CG10_big_fil_rev_8_21_14_0_10_30_48]